MLDQGARALVAAIFLLSASGAAALPAAPGVELRAQSVRPLTGVDGPHSMELRPLAEPGLYTLVAEVDAAGAPRHPPMSLPLPASVGLIGTVMTLVAWRGLARRHSERRRGWSAGSAGSDLTAPRAGAC